MKKRLLGSTGIEVSEVGFGAWQLGNTRDWSGSTGSDAVALVQEALDRGVNFFDTAPNYAEGNSEDLLGKALDGKRQHAVISTKFGHDPEGESSFDQARLRPSVERSLRKLRTDYLDVLLLHNPPEEHFTDSSPLYGELEKLKEEGKIRSYGVSLDWSREIEQVLTRTGSQVLEVMFNIFHQEPKHAFPLIREKKTGIIIKVPLDSGWLTGKYSKESSFHGVRSRWSEEDIARRGELVDRLRYLEGPGRTLTQAALRFVLHYEEVSSVIPGVRTSGQLESNLKAAEDHLSDDEVEKLETFWRENLEENPLPW